MFNNNETIRKLINETKKMPLRQIVEEKQAIINSCPYYKNKLNKVKPEQTIYRIECFDCFLDNVKNNQLYFAWPGKWKDKGGDIFDGAFVRIPIYFRKGNILANHAYRQDYFCQCWSCKESETMWKQYSKKPDENVMIVSTVDKVMKQIWTDESCGKYVGMVKYRPVENIRKENFFQSEFNASCNIFNEIGMAQTFLFKPDNLSYEREVRFIARMKAEQEQQKERDSILVNILSKPHDFIDKILIDPRASRTFEIKARNALSQYCTTVERSSRSQKAIEEADISMFYKANENNYGLPEKYSFTE